MIQHPIRHDDVVFLFCEVRGEGLGDVGMDVADAAVGPAEGLLNLPAGEEHFGGDVHDVDAAGAEVDCGAGVEAAAASEVEDNVGGLAGAEGGTDEGGFEPHVGDGGVRGVLGCYGVVLGSGGHFGRWRV